MLEDQLAKENLEVHYGQKGLHMKTIYKDLIMELKVLTHGFKESTHEDKGQSLKMNDQESTHELKVSTHRDKRQGF